MQKALLGGGEVLAPTKSTIFAILTDGTCALLYHGACNLFGGNFANGKGVKGVFDGHENFRQAKRALG